MARPRKLIETATGKIGKDEIEARKKEEAALEEFESISFTPPTWLSTEAKKEYKRIVPLLSKLPIASLDLASVEMYCDFYSKYKKMSLAVEKEGETIIEYGARGDEKSKVNPKYTVMKDSASMVRTLSGNLGMTIDSRMRIVVPKKEEIKDPFADFADD